MKKIFTSFLLAIILFSLSSCTNNVRKLYPSIEGKIRIKIKTFNGIYDCFTKKGKYVVILAFSPKYYECPYCDEVMPIINNALIKSDMTAFYLDIFKMRQDNSKEYQNLLDLINKQIEENKMLEKLEIRNDKPVLVVPDIYIIEDGQILDHHIATFIENDEYKLSLNETEKEKLLNKYLSMINLIK